MLVNEEEEKYYSTLDDLCELCHDDARRSGFWDMEANPGERNPSEMIALMHSELSEMLEVIRKPEPRMSEKDDRMTEEEEEAADLFIRLADYCGGRGLILGQAVRLKRAYNASRPYKHNKQF